MAKGRFTHPRFSADDEDQPLKELKIPDLSLELLDEDYLKSLGLADPNLLDLNIDIEPVSAPKLIDPEALDLRIEESQASNAGTPSIHAEDFPAERKEPETEFPWTIADSTLPTSGQILPVQHNRQNSMAKVLMIAGGILLSLILVFGCYIGVALAFDPYENRILDNVTVLGINIGNMTRKEAAETLNRAVENTFSQQDMVVSLPHDTITLSAADTRASLNVRGVVRAAYRYGRYGSKAEKQTALDNAAETIYAVDISKYLKLDQDYIRQQLSAYASKYETTLTQYTYHMEGKMPSLEEEAFDAAVPCQTLEITLGSPALGLNMEEVFYSILEAYCQNHFQVTVTDIDPAAKPDPVDLDVLLEKYHIEPVSASLDMEKYCPIPGDYGYTFHLEEAQKIIDAAEYGETVSIPMAYVEPEIMQDEVYFRDVLGESKTPHTNNENRNENLRIACSKINGLILQPGDEFSYNDTLGQRTKENGYKPAPAYSGTTLVDSYGGGICQVSSTLYYCTLLSDLEIVSRINHGFPATYIDLGMDATVSWGGPDFKFKNNTHFPIKIEAWVENGCVNVHILGTIEKDYYVQMEYEIIGGQDPATTYEEHSPDDGYYDGQVIRPGTVGQHIRTYRCKYNRETDELISRDFEAQSNYMPTDRVVVRIIE